MKRAVVYGAGKIGRGFIGKVFADAGFEVAFLDKLPGLVAELDRRGEYPLRIVSNEATRNFIVGPVRALLSTTPEAVEEIAGCALMATAVGVNNLPDIVPVIAKAVALRMEQGGGALDVLLCENQLDAHAHMRALIYRYLNGAQRAWADAKLGLVQTSISRMVPPITPEMLAEDALLIRADGYSELPVDSEGFRGEVPALPGIVPYAPFEFYIRRKLFENNGAHAACAYLGYLRGCETIWQAMADPEIYVAVEAIMRRAGEALVVRFGDDVRANVEAYADELLVRFQNRPLGDTVARVGADPARKLRRDDRLIGSALFCLEQGLDPAPMLRGVAAALAFRPEGDSSAAKLQADLAERGLDYVVEHTMGLSPEERLFALVKEACAKC